MSDKIISFSVANGVARFGNKTRRALMRKGCNEPFKDYYWCPKRRWFQKSPCPFINKHECWVYETMCGCL